MIGVVYLGAVAALAAVTTLLPALLIALYDGDVQLAQRISLFVLVTALLPSLTLLAVKGRGRSLPRMHGLLAVVGIWIVTVTVATGLCAGLLRLPMASAAFEATSALTTSGVTTIVRKDELPRALLFWRVALEWFGGLLTLACLMQIVAPAGLGGLPQFTAQLFSRPSRGRLVDPSERLGHDDPHSLRRTRRIAVRYVLGTLLLWLMLIPAGPPAMEAGMLAMVSIATAGFVFFDGALLDRLPAHTILIMAFGLALGATSILWQSGTNFSASRFARRNVEALAIAIIVALIAFAVAVRLATVSGIAALQPGIIVEGLFAGASLVATSGLETRPGVIALIPDVLVLVVVFAGASLFSTTGGVKLYRLLGLLRYAERELVRLIYPHSVARLQIGGRPVADETLRAIWAYFVFAVLFILLGAFGLTLGPFNFEAAFKASTALFVSAGPLYAALTPAAGVAEAGWPLFTEIDAPFLLWSCVIMLLGRLEILVVFAALNIRFWMGR